MKLTPQELKLTLYFLYDEVKDLTVKELINKIDKMDEYPISMYKFECDTHIELSRVINTNLSSVV